MASGSRRKKQQRKEKAQKTLIAILSAIIAVLILLSAAMGIGESAGADFLSWDHLYEWLGMVPLESRLPEEAQNSATKIHFIDVGQGDSILLEQDGMFGLIDAGERDQAQTVCNYLHDAGVKTLEFMLMTHPHSDHIGGMREVMNQFEVKQIILPDFSKAPMATSSTFIKLLEAIEEKKIPAVTARTGDVFPLGGASLTVVGNGIETDDLNNISIMTMFEAPGIRFLSTGDAEKEEEQAALDSGADLRADLFKAGHHGSSTSNTRAFLSAVRPRAAVISCGKDNSYGHPHREAMDAFAGAGIQVYRTDLNGTVIAYVDEQQQMQIAVTKQEAA